jgi:hypothetical protein
MDQFLVGCGLCAGRGACALTPIPMLTIATTIIAPIKRLMSGSNG